MNELLARWRASAREGLQQAMHALRRRPLRFAVALLVGLPVIYVLVLIPFTPSIADIRKAKIEKPAVVLSIDGQEIAEFRRANREWVRLADISPDVVAALISTEDHRFRDHHGLDLRRTLSAIALSLSGDVQGGSTITQQLARNLYPEEIGRARSITRKIKEAITALKIEAVYTKDEILETYLNTVPFLYNAYGIEMAARTYFDKSADKLDALESATLIGMLKGTSYYNPVVNPQRSLQRRNIVLSQMVKHGQLTAARFEALKKRPLKIDFERQTESLGPAPHVTQQLRRWLIEWADRRGYNIFADGLVVRTTIDSRLQAQANAAVARQGERLQALADARVRQRGAEKPRVQVGFLATDPRNGHVKAWVGSRDFATDPFDHVHQARRQPGSTFKPFVYGAAFAQGLAPSYTFVDEAVEIALGGGTVWRPSDGTPPSGQPMTLRDGLAFSKNTITAQLMQKVGPAAVATLARDLGVRQSRLDVVPSLALGTSPVTLREMVAAYGSIANGGSYIEPVLLLRIEDRNGRVLEDFLPVPPQTVAQRSTMDTLIDVLRGAIDRGTGAAIRSRYGISADLAGKTGTTQDNTDGWFILMHPEMVAGAWVGFNDSRITMADSWGPGARSALPIVGEFFQQGLRLRLIDAKQRFAAPQAADPSQAEALVERVTDWLSRLFPGASDAQRSQDRPPPNSGVPAQQQANPKEQDLSGGP
ncbi:MAG: transglycosylase domain-containing protein [Burkholderiaceae bacterium]|nr:transglycosylase domain-containing protein [Burkholderiaceae bacterium]